MEKMPLRSRLSFLEFSKEAPRIRRVGCYEERAFNFVMIAAPNVELESAV